MRPRTGIAAFVALVGVGSALAAGSAAQAATGGDQHGGGQHGGGQHWGQDGHGTRLVPGDLLVSTSVYTNDAAIKAGVTQLPPGCTGSDCVTAVADGSYPQVFNNAAVDGSFGVTSRLYLRQITTSGRPAGVIAVPASELTTSFSSKSEGALNLSTDGASVTFVGYKAAPDTADVSNASTPGEPDPGNAVPAAYYRVVGQLNARGHFSFTETNAYTEDNGRAAIAATIDGKEYIYAAGNASSSTKPQAAGTIVGAGAQLITPSALPESEQEPGQPTPVGSFSITELGDSADKIGKDDNFRGLTIHDNVLYYTKGSGSKGVETVYFVDTTGKACPNGIGLPEPGAKLPTSGLSYDAATVQADGLPSNMCILKGFPTALANTATDDSSRPFGIWFANSTTLYVADEGSGDNAYANGSYTAAATSPVAGLQKWVFNKAAGEWQLAYTLQDGLNLGSPYTVRGYPTGVNPATGLPWAPAADGLRNLTGRVNPNGTVTIWAATSTVSGSGDQGADPNKLVAITDRLGATSPSPGERFTTTLGARNAQVIRGVSFAPGTRTW